MAVVVVAAGAAIVYWPVSVWWQARKQEKPKYMLLKTLETTRKFAPDVEIRRYDPYKVAEVTFDKTEVLRIKDALYEGSSLLSQYFSDSKGKGQTDAPNRGKIPMTAPVMVEISEDSYKVAVMMPSKQGIPTPASDRVRIRTVDAATLAVYSFKGKSPKDLKVEKRRQQLLGVLTRAGLSVPEGAALRVNQYHSPSAPNWQRLNEVLLPVDLPKAAGF